VETIRYYERRGLLRQPVRPESGYRRYPLETVKRVRFIKSAQGLGFSLREIQELLDLGSGPRSDCSEVLALANRKINEVERKIQVLEKIRSALGELASHCPAKGSLSICPIWERLGSETERKEVR
jgi:MerR family mercuric resistance operon transcriptional regulator